MCIANSQSFDLWMKHPPHLPRTMVGAERQYGLSSSAGSTPFGHQLSSRPLDPGGGLVNPIVLQVLITSREKLMHRLQRLMHTSDTRV